MSEYQPLRTRKDLYSLRKACRYFKDMQIKATRLSAGLFGNTLTLFLAGPDRTPMVKIVFHGVKFYALDNDPILGIRIGIQKGIFCVGISHNHSWQKQIGAKSTILARKIEWKSVKE